MPDLSLDAPALPSESGRRLHAALRALLSPGIWLVLAVQIALVFSMQWRVPADAPPVTQVLVTVLAATLLMLFYYLQAGAFHALSRGRNTLPVSELIRSGRSVFAAFVWLTLKAGLLLVVAMNIFIYVAVLITGSDLKTLIGTLAPFFGPAVGILALVFVYWLPWVFLRQEFHLFPSLKAALRIARARLSHAAFPALLLLAPIIVAGLLPDRGPISIDLLVNVVSGVMGWMAYIYCVEVLQDQQPNTGSEAFA